MESTGVFWKPIYNLLVGLDLMLLVVNARHIKAAPGRKTDPDENPGQRKHVPYVRFRTTWSGVKRA